MTENENDMGAMLRSAAENADAGKEVSLPAETPEVAAGDVTTDGATDEVSNPETNPEKPTDKPEAEKPEEKPESDYTKAKKERERREKSWKQLEEEKESFRKEREEWQRTVKAAPVKPSEPSKDAKGYTVNDYEEAAKEFEADGNKSMADAARSQAELLKAKDAAANTASAPSLETEWKANMETALKADPTLLDPKSPVVPILQNLLQEREDIFSRLPNGFPLAVEVAKLQLEAGSVSGLKTEIEKIRSENDRLTKLTSISGSGPVQHPSPKKFEDMDENEQESQLRKMMADA